MNLKAGFISLIFLICTINAAAQLTAPDGLTAEKLIVAANERRADLIAARGRLTTAQARILIAGQRLNPVLDAEYGSTRILGGDPESEFSAGITQVFETGGKRRKRIAVAEIEAAQIAAEIAALERRVASEIRQNYARAVAAARQIELFEELQRADAELLRVTEVRLKEGDVAPLDANLVRVESDRLRIQMIDLTGEFDIAVLELKTLAGFDADFNLQIAPQPERPPRMDLSLADLTANALQNRADLRAARLAEDASAARIDLAKAEKRPDIAASARFTRSTGVIDLPAPFQIPAIDRDNELTFGLSVELPFFNRRRGEIAVATAEREATTRNREFLEATIRRDAAIAFRRYRTAAEKLVLYATQILPRSRANLQSVQAAYGFGEFSIFEVVNEQRRLIENAANYNAAVRDYYQSLVEIEIATGAPLLPSAFAPPETSVLPEKEFVPDQFEK